MQGINSSSTYNSVCLAAAGMEIVNPPFIPLVDPRRAGSEIGPTELVTVRQCIGRPNAHYRVQFCRPIDRCMHSVVATHKEYTTYGLGTSMYGEF